ncbi:MAG: hypothetical protein VX930_08670, partial [Pseudomonadota bacterium]|nr:hypothetical protein [Pseudomonadota bacterium]
ARKRIDMPQTRPPEMRRSWLFVGGADEAALIAAADSGEDYRRSMRYRPPLAVTPPHLKRQS